VTAKDDSGNKSTGNIIVTIVDTTAPVVTGSNISHNSNEAVPSDAAIISEAGIKVTDNTGESLAATVDTSAVNWNVAGTYTVTVTATDASGNVGTTTIQVTVVDTTAPTDPTANVMDQPNNTATISGEGEPGATITITDPNGNVVAQTTVDPSGNYSVDVPRPANENTDYVVTATDEAGNTSNGVKVTVVGDDTTEHTITIHFYTADGTKSVDVVLTGKTGEAVAFNDVFETVMQLEKEGYKVAELPYIPTNFDSKARGSLVFDVLLVAIKADENNNDNSNSDNSNNDNTTSSSTAADENVTISNNENIVENSGVNSNNQNEVTPLSNQVVQDSVLEGGNPLITDSPDNYNDKISAKHDTQAKQASMEPMEVATTLAGIFGLWLAFFRRRKEEDEEDVKRENDTTK